MASNKPAYGQVNVEMVNRWLQLPAEEDGPFWALNLMKYREVAAYADGNPSAVSGKAADDAYSPLGPLKAIGAMVAFHGDVLDQRAGDPQWDRIGIVRYPTRAAFFAMQQRDDFKDKHEHKEAGMEFTIVMSCLPTGSARSPWVPTTASSSWSNRRGGARGPGRASSPWRRSLSKVSSWVTAARSTTRDVSFGSATTRRCKAW